jgi:uncharacterized protein YaaN involved in tellurite resistance
VRRQLAGHQAHVTKVEQNQERLRHNIKSMEKVENKSLVDRYLQDLNNQEDDLIATNSVLEQLADDQAEATVELEQVRSRITAEATKLREALDA